MVDLKKALKNFEDYINSQGEENLEKYRLVELNNEAVEASKSCLSTIALILDGKDLTDEEEENISKLLESLINVSMYMQTLRLLITLLYGEEGDANEQKGA